MDTRRANPSRLRTIRSTVPAENRRAAAPGCSDAEPASPGTANAPVRATETWDHRNSAKRWAVECRQRTPSARRAVISPTRFVIASSGLLISCEMLVASRPAIKQPDGGAPVGDLHGKTTSNTPDLDLMKKTPIPVTFCSTLGIPL